MQFTEEKREELEQKAQEEDDLEGAKEIIKDTINEGQIDDFTEQEQSISDNSWEEARKNERR